MNNRNVSSLMQSSIVVVPISFFAFREVITSSIKCNPYLGHTGQSTESPFYDLLTVPFDADHCLNGLFTYATITSLQGVFIVVVDVDFPTKT